jgi:hypothetical protein
LKPYRLAIIRVWLKLPLSAMNDLLLNTPDYQPRARFLSDNARS